jgi:hypothetical protein
MKIIHTARMLMSVAALLAAPAIAFSQDAISEPAQKTIGVGKPKMVPSLIVLNARGATLQGSKLTLIGVSANSIMFADRPVRAAGHALTARLLEEWNGSDSFGKDPPNATVSVFNKEGNSVHDAVLVLKSPQIDGDKLTFDVQLLEGDLSGADGPATVFIDTIGWPFSPLSFAGAARRTANQGAWYRGYAAAAAPYEPGSSLANPGPMPWQ